jgi:acyl-CoA reductase-like NAD-dependent aldehyde dehydrogenase
MTGLNTLKSQSANLKIAKTIKLFIGGEFPRTESGRSFPIYVHKSKNLYANVCLASRKDLRNAVTAAQAAQHGWQSKSAYNRGQILYRMAEMLEAKRTEFVETLTTTLGYTQSAANKSVDGAIDSLVYYAGFSDKYQQVLGAVNPVSGPHHNFTSTEAVGVVALVGNQNFDLSNFVAQIAAIIVSGNTVVALMSEMGSAVIAPLSEALATSDLSKGVVNLLTGNLEELYKHFATHMEINSISFQTKDAKKLAEVKTEAAANMKRVVSEVKSANSLEHLISFVEFKTVWHPIGN